MDRSTALSTDELMHLALHATRNDSPDKAITQLKRLLDIQPENGKALYLLGALHAEIGMHDLAAEEMARALELEPDMPTARFQLGLLHITAGKVAEAEDTWRGLDGLGDEDPLFLFKEGMLNLVRDEFEQCVKALKTGIELNTLNEDLNNDMRQVVQDAEHAMAQRATLGNGPSGEEIPRNSQQMLLSAYRSQDADDT